MATALQGGLSTPQALRKECCGHVRARTRVGDGAMERETGLEPATFSLEG
jgi:hypothetical protein